MFPFPGRGRGVLGDLHPLLEVLNKLRSSNPLSPSFLPQLPHCQRKMSKNTPLDGWKVGTPNVSGWFRTAPRYLPHARCLWPTRSWLSFTGCNE